MNKVAEEVARLKRRRQIRRLALVAVPILVVIGLLTTALILWPLPSITPPPGTFEVLGSALGVFGAWWVARIQMRHDARLQREEQLGARQNAADLLQSELRRVVSDFIDLAIAAGEAVDTFHAEGRATFDVALAKVETDIRAILDLKSLAPLVFEDSLVLATSAAQAASVLRLRRQWAADKDPGYGNDVTLAETPMTPLTVLEFIRTRFVLLRDARVTLAYGHGPQSEQWRTAVDHTSGWLKMSANLRRAMTDAGLI